MDGKRETETTTTTEMTTAETTTPTTTTTLLETVPTCYACRMVVLESDWETIADLRLSSFPHTYHQHHQRQPEGKPWNLEQMRGSIAEFLLDP